ncbi:MAG: hypothetical protein PHQ72_09240 [Hespellia sp.]|nr:hypothetical protein [Hespellia sp.]
MSIFEYDEELHMKQVKEEGRQEGETHEKIKVMKKMIDKNLDVDTMGELLDEPIDFVEKICKFVKENPSANVDTIWKML